MHGAETLPCYSNHTIALCRLAEVRHYRHHAFGERPDSDLGGKLGDVCGDVTDRYNCVALSCKTKRHGAASVRELREAGYASLAVCNDLFRLGHTTASNQVLTLEQMAAARS